MSTNINGSEASPQGIKAKGCCGCRNGKLNTFDYLSDLPKGYNEDDFVEVQFKNTRKGYYLNSLKISLQKGDMVAVESAPGHDIGQVTLTGKLVSRQMQKSRYRHPNGEPRRVYRLAKASDIEKYNEVKAIEEDTMIRSRKIAEGLGLDMKIGDVEYQGDGQKAIFYYIAEGRVDFRQLIKKLAEVFHIRVEMKQIGVRQEAGRIGGIGPCGRQLCCSGWMTNFVSVGTNSARLQDLSLNPYKLAGQCGKLKCCLNYEVDTYFEAQHHVPPRNTELKTGDGVYHFFKSDILAGTVSYQLKNQDKRIPSDPITITNKRAFEIIELNNRGEIPDSILHGEEVRAREELSMNHPDILASESVTRFDRERSTKSSKKKNDWKRGDRRERNNNHEKQEKAMRASSVDNKRRRSPKKDEVAKTTLHEQPRGAESRNIGGRREQGERPRYKALSSNRRRGNRNREKERI